MAEAGEEQDVGAEVEAEALEMGWTPKEQWKGDESRWISAEDYVKRGREVLPIVQKKNKELHSSVSQLTQQVQALRGELQAQAASMKAIEDSQAADLVEQLKATKAEIGRQLKEAKDAGDTEREVELIEQLTDLKAGEKAAKEKPAPVVAAPKAEALSPEYLAWRERNAWVDSDPKRARRAMLVAQEIAEDHEGKLTGKPFFDKLDQELAKLNGGAALRNREDRVEGGRPRGGSGNSKSYADLPADAKAACDRLATKLVGPNRAHKDAASWRASYTKQYFSDEAGA